MGRNNPYSLDFMLKIKKINPDFKFSGKDEERWQEFIESQKEDSLFETIKELKCGDYAGPVEEVKEEKPKKKRTKKVKQVAERKNTESMDYFVENEINEESA